MHGHTHTFSWQENLFNGIQANFMLLLYVDRQVNIYLKFCVWVSVIVCACVCLCMRERPKNGVGLVFLFY